MAAFSQLEAVSAEGVGIDDVSAAFNVKAVYFHYSLGVGEVEKLGNVLGLDAMSLQHSAHAAVKKYEAAVFKQGIEFLGHIYLLIQT